MWWLVACRSSTAPEVEAVELPSAQAYTAACEEALGPVPPLSCDDVDPVPQSATLADGTVVPLVDRGDRVPDGSCDRPSIFSGCVPGSRAGVVENATGARFYLLCRVRRADAPEGLYDDIALLGRDEADGTTCMWGAPEDGAWRDGAALPKPGSADDDGFWAEPEALAGIACRSCHDGNGIVVTPWIAANLPPTDPAGPMTLRFAEALAAIDPDAGRGHGFGPIEPTTRADPGRSRRTPRLIDAPGGPMARRLPARRTARDGRVQRRARRGPRRVLDPRAGRRAPRPRPAPVRDRRRDD
ncbi:MAG: hypothetical protein ABMB14_09055 [Myxococcota bacterium]